MVFWTIGEFSTAWPGPMYFIMVALRVGRCSIDMDKKYDDVLLLLYHLAETDWRFQWFWGNYSKLPSRSLTIRP